MRVRICICCGNAIASEGEGADVNPNLCSACARIDEPDLPGPPAPARPEKRVRPRRCFKPRAPRLAARRA